MVISTSHDGRFQLEGYVWVAQFVPLAVCELATRYARMKQHIEPGRVDAQVPRFACSVYGDPLMESLAETVWPRIEAIVEEPLWPTYTYYRVYETGAVLKPHMDRGSCEVSASICLGADHGDAAPEGSNWPLWLKSLEGRDQSCRMLPGDIVIYQGCDLVHWREAYQGKWQVQVFLHFVRQRGPFATLAKYDCRPALGMPGSTRDEEQCARLAKLEWLRFHARHLRLRPRAR
jgi:hypothetical protein